MRDAWLRARGFPDIASVNAARAEACHRNGDSFFQNDLVERCPFCSRETLGIIRAVWKVIDIKNDRSGNHGTSQGATSGFIYTDDVFQSA